MARIARFVTALSAFAALALSLACILQLHAMGLRLDAMTATLASMSHTMAAADCRDCRTRLASGVRP